MKRSDESSNRVTTLHFYNHNVDRRGRSSIVPIGVTLFVCALFAVGVFFIYLGAKVPPSLPVPALNAYEQMVRLGVSVQGVPEDIMEADADQLRGFVATNREILNELDQVLRNDSVVPVEYSNDYLNRELNRIPHLRNLHRLRVAEARLADLEGRSSDAANSYVQLLFAGRKSQYGGFTVHVMVGSAYERESWNQIARLSDRLSAAEKSSLLAKLRSLPAREPIGNVLERESAFGAETIGRFRAFVMRKQTEAVLNKTKQLIAEMEALEQRTIESLSP